MTVREQLHQMRHQIEKIASKHGAMNVRIFGSVARGDETDKSDVDLLVATGDKTSSWFPGGLVIELEKIIGRKVDVVTEKGINPLIREQVMKEATLL